MLYRFCDFTIDDSTFELRTNGERVAIEPKALDILLFLIARRDAVVSSRDLLDNIWPDTNVTANALTRAISQLRRVLHDDPRAPRIILTVPRRGYRFVAAISEERVVMPVPRGRPAHHRLSAAAVVVCAILSLCIPSSGRRPVSEPVAVPQRPAPIAAHVQEPPPLPGDAVVVQKTKKKATASAPVETAKLSYRKVVADHPTRSKPLVAALSRKPGKELFKVGSQGGSPKMHRGGWSGVDKKTGTVKPPPAGKFAPLS